jgi:hypothetical protein
MRSTETGPLKISALNGLWMTAAGTELPIHAYRISYSTTKLTLDEFKASDICKCLDYLHGLLF